MPWNRQASAFIAERIFGLWISSNINFAIFNWFPNFLTLRTSPVCWVCRIVRTAVNNLPQLDLISHSLLRICETPTDQRIKPYKAPDDYELTRYRLEAHDLTRDRFQGCQLVNIYWYFASCNRKKNNQLLINHRQILSDIPTMELFSSIGKFTIIYKEYLKEQSKT